MDTFAKRLVFLRELRDLNQEDVAALLGVKRQAVTNWEGGGGITNANMQRLAIKLDCDFSWLATGNGPPPTPAENVPMTERRADSDEIVVIYNEIDDELKPTARRQLEALRDARRTRAGN